jgi:hypothetical protein
MIKFIIFIILFFFYTKQQTLSVMTNYQVSTCTMGSEYQSTLYYLERCFADPFGKSIFYNSTSSNFFSFKYSTPNCTGTFSNITIPTLCSSNSTIKSAVTTSSISTINQKLGNLNNIIATYATFV